jgi:hypothetical protein
MVRHLHVQTSVDPLHILGACHVHRCTQLSGRERFVQSHVLRRLRKVRKYDLWKNQISNAHHSHIYEIRVNAYLHV